MTKINKLLMLFLAGLFFSCGGEDLDDNEMLAFTATNLSAEISTNDLVGTWELESMVSDVAVDFNDEDDVAHKDVMVETDCFDEMYYVFDSGGKVDATQARLYFDSTGITSCESGNYSATYKVEGDVLAITFDFDGSSVTERKEITLSDDKMLMTMNLTRTEASQYINDDSNSSTSEIGNLKMEYRKVN